MSSTSCVPASVPSDFQSSGLSPGSRNGTEEERAGDVHQESGGRGTAAGDDVLDELRPRLGAVGLPELPAVRRSSALKKSVPPTSVSSTGPELCAPGVDVLDQLRPRRGAVGLPELLAVRAVVGPEEERAADVRELEGAGPAAGVDVLDERRPRRGAVGVPQLPAVRGSLAEKKSVPPTFVRNAGYELVPPGWMSLTSFVPAAVPSDFQSSLPWVPS